MPVFLVTVKLPKNKRHDPHNKVTGECPVTGRTCTDVTGEHHTTVFIGADVHAANAHFSPMHVTRIEEVDWT